MTSAIRNAFCLLLASISLSGSAYAQTEAAAAPVTLPPTAFDPNAIVITQQRNEQGQIAPEGSSPIQRNPDGIAGPPAPRPWTDHVPSDVSAYPTFGSQVSKVKGESLILLGYFTAINSPKFFKETRPFHFKDEGWFGKSTANLGVDKLTHAFDSYILAEFLHMRLHRKTEASNGDAITAAALAAGLMAYSEIYDGIEETSGFSLQDITMNMAGAGFSVLRNTVPGLKEKLDFRVMIVPNSSIYSHKGKRHYAQQRFLMALQLAGFESLKNSPLRLVELHAGYYSSDFTHEAIANGKEPKRHLFFGVGLNVGELLFGQSRSGFGRVAGTALDYLQLPYTAAHVDTQGRSTW